MYYSVNILSIDRNILISNFFPHFLNHGLIPIIYLLYFTLILSKIKIMIAPEIVDVISNILYS